MNINNSNVLGLRNGILTKSNSDNNNFYINFCFDRRYNTNLSYNTDLNYNPFTQTLTCPNFIGNITANKVEVTDSDYNGNLKLTFSDGNNNLLDNAGLLYHPFFRILKVESNNSQTYQLLLKNSGQSAGIQIKGAPAVTQYEANITHYLDILKIQNTGSDTEIEQVGSGTIYIYNANGSLTLNGSGNIVASGIYAGNGSLLTSLTTANLNGLVQNNQLQNSNITIGSTIFNLGDTKTTISGLTSVTSDLFDGKLYIEEKSDSTNYSLLFSVIPLGVNNERLINTDTNIYWNPYLSTLTCYRLDGYATGLELQSFSNIKPFVFCDGGIVTTQSVYTTSSNDLCWDNNNKRLGIGIANPLYKLQVVGTQFGTGNSTHFDVEIGDYDNTTYNKMVSLGTDQNGAYNSGGISIWQNGSDESIRLSGGNNQPSYINSGNLGVGVSIPSTKLHIGNSANAVQLTIDGATTYSGAGFLIGGWSGNNDVNKHTIQSSFNLHIDSSDNGDIYMNYYSARSMNLCVGGGNVGIGTPVPQNKLHIFSTSTTIAFIESTTNASYMKTKNGSSGISYFGTDGNGLMNIDAGATIVGSSGKNIYIAPGLSAKMTITSAGNVGIGNTNPNYTLDITGATHSRNNIYIAADDAVLSRFLSIEHATSTPSTARFIECLYNQTEIGSCTQNGTTAVLWNTTSDYRVKENVLDCDDGYNKILSLRPVNFNYKGDNFKNTGFIAHEIQKIIPEIVCGDFDDVEDYCVNCKRRCDDCKCKKCDISSRPKLQQLDYGKITPFLVHSIQVLTKKIDELNKENDELKENQKKIIQKLNQLINPDGWFQNSI